MKGFYGIRVSTRRRPIGFVVLGMVAWAAFGAFPVDADEIGYLALWREDTGAYRYFYGVKGNHLHGLFQNQLEQGFRAVSIDVRDTGFSNRRYALVFRPGSGGQYWATGKSIDDFKALSAKRFAEGYRIAAFDVDDGEIYAVWRPGTGGQRWRAGMSWSQFEARNKEYAADGLRLTALEKYDGDRFAAVWRSGSGGYRYASGRSLAQFEALDREARDEGLRLDWIETHEGKFIGIWRPGTGAQSWYSGLTASQLEEMVESKAAQGLRLRILRSKEYDNLGTGGNASPPPIQVPKRKTQCGIDNCGAGYHPEKYSYGSNCEGSGPNQTLCVENLGAQFYTCGDQCPAGYFADSHGYSDDCRIFEKTTAELNDNETLCKKGSGQGQSQSALTQAPVKMLARPAITGRQLGHLDVVGRGMDRRFYLSTWNGDEWSTWSPIGTGTFQSGPAIAVEKRRDGVPRLQVAGQGDDRRVYWATWDGKAWSDWSPIGAGRFTSAPAIVGGSSPVVVARGDDRRMWLSEYDGGWGGWSPIGTGTFSSAPAMIRHRGKLGVFALGDDRGLWVAWRENGAWSGWSRIGEGTFRSAPSVVTWGEDRLDLFALGDDREVYQLTWRPSGWTWHPLDGVGVFRSAPAAWSAQANRIDLVAIGEDARIYHKAWTGSGWSPWLEDTPVGRFQ